MNENHLSLDKQQKLERLRHHLPAIHTYLLQRSGVLPIIASLCIALLVVFSFSDDLLPLSSGELKILIIILLTSIPLSLFFYLFENHRAIHKTYEAIKEILEEEPIVEPKSFIKRFLRIILAYHAWIFVAMLSLVIFYVIVFIWQSI